MLATDLTGKWEVNSLKLVKSLIEHHPLLLASDFTDSLVKFTDLCQ